MLSTNLTRLSKQKLIGLSLLYTINAKNIKLNTNKK